MVALPNNGYPAWLSEDKHGQITQVASGLPLASPSEMPQKIRDVRSALDKKNQPSTNFQWVVSSFFLNTWIQAVPQGLASLAELSTLVQLRAPFLFGAPLCGEQWTVSADWQSSGHMVCHAIPQVALDALGDLPVSSLLTLALSALRTLGNNDPATSWYAVTAADELHILAMRNGAPLALRSTRQTAGATPEQLVSQVHALWQREQAKTDWPLGKLRWLHCGSQLPKELIASIDVECIAPKLEEESLAGLHSTHSEAERMVGAARALSKMSEAL